MNKKYNMIDHKHISQERSTSSTFSEIITNNKQMLEIFDYLELVSFSDESILITGECGVGKELIARAIHDLSGRPGKFIPVNIAGLDDTMVSDALFGHKRGAFTGADKDRKGLIEEARGGTLFLDEIGDLSLTSQVKLLRLLQEKEYTPLGSDRSCTSHIRVVTATNKDLIELIHQKQFRKDLFYRLDIHHVHIPPLRERKDDIVLLSRYFIEEKAKELNVKKPLLTPEAITLLQNYRYPGNIRELRSILVDAVCLSKEGILSPSILRRKLDPQRSNDLGDIDGFSDKKEGDAPVMTFHDGVPTIKDAVQLLVREALKRCGGKQTKAAAMLGITRQALSKRLQNESYASLCL